MRKKKDTNLPVTPLLAVDCVVVDTKKNVLLIRRKNPPFKGALALPGGFVEIGERVDEACRRELKEETGLREKSLQLIGVYSDPNRDPRGHICSVVFACLIQRKYPKAGDDATEIVWTNSWRRYFLAFDHKKIIYDAFNIL